MFLQSCEHYTRRKIQEAASVLQAGLRQITTCTFVVLFFLHEGGHLGHFEVVEPEVGDLQHPARVDEAVGRLEVPV